MRCVYDTKISKPLSTNQEDHDVLFRALSLHSGRDKCLMCVDQNQNYFILASMLNIPGDCLGPFTWD